MDGREIYIRSLPEIVLSGQTLKSVYFRQVFRNKHTQLELLGERHVPSDDQLSIPALEYVIKSQESSVFFYEAHDRLSLDIMQDSGTGLCKSSKLISKAACGEIPQFKCKTIPVDIRYILYDIQEAFLRVLCETCDDFNTPISKEIIIQMYYNHKMMPYYTKLNPLNREIIDKIILETVDVNYDKYVEDLHKITPEFRKTCRELYEHELKKDTTSDKNLDKLINNRHIMLRITRTINTIRWYIMSYIKPPEFAWISHMFTFNFYTIIDVYMLCQLLDMNPPQAIWNAGGDHCEWVAQQITKFGFEQV